jgi:hypothetical protein
VPVPSPIISVQSSSDIKNKIVWSDDIERLSAAPFGARLKSSVRYYKVLRAPHPLGPWLLLDSVGRRDMRYYDAAVSSYTFRDPNSKLTETYFYSVVSVDSAGTTSTITNMQKHTTTRGAETTMMHVYVAPNPLIVTSTFGGSASIAGYDVMDKVAFIGLPKRATIRIFSYSGQHVQSIDHNDINSNSVEWFQISRNNQLLASGVYFFTVDDLDTGKRATGKFVIIH